MTVTRAMQREMRERRRYFAEVSRAIEAAGTGDARSLALLLAELRIDVTELMRPRPMAKK